MDCTFEAGCKGSRVIGFDYCPPHLATTKGLNHARDRILSGALFTEDDVESEIARRGTIPEKDYHTSALEKMDRTLTELMDFTEQTKTMLFSIPPANWRYEHRTSGEQVRMEVSLYERALDRSTRVLKDVSKMAIEEKTVSLGRQQVELMIRILMGVVMDIGLNSDQITHARAVLLRRFQEEANLSSKLEHKVTAELGSSNYSGTVIDG